MERDDIYEYSLDHIHGEAEGKKIVRWFNIVILILTAITIFELFLGFQIPKTSEHWWMVKWTFLILTILKAGFIVMEFMHLSDERKQLRWIILIPYISFISYLVFICLWEGDGMHNILEYLKHF